MILCFIYLGFIINQPALTCLNLTIETLEQGAKYVQRHHYVEKH